MQVDSEAASGDGLGDALAQPGREQLGQDDDDDDREQDRGHVLARRRAARSRAGTSPCRRRRRSRRRWRRGRRRPRCRSRCRSRRRAPAAARRRRRPAAGWRRSRGSPRPGPGRIASIASENSLPAKPMQKSVSASAPGSMPKPSTVTSRIVQIISWTERQRHDDEARRPVEEAPARRRRCSAANQASGTASARPSTVARYDICSVSTTECQYSALSDVADVGREVAPRQHLAHAAEHAGQALEVDVRGSRSRTRGRRASRAARRTCRGSADSESGSRSRRRVGGAWRRADRRPRAMPRLAPWRAARSARRQMTAWRA